MVVLGIVGVVEVGDGSGQSSSVGDPHGLSSSTASLWWAFHLEEQKCSNDCWPMEFASSQEMKHPNWPTLKTGLEHLPFSNLISYPW